MEKRLFRYAEDSNQSRCSIVLRAGVSGVVCISVSAVTAAYGSALTAGHFWKSAKSNHGPAAKGHPWPSAATSASMPRCPLRNACVRPAWLTGRPRSTSTARRPNSRPGSPGRTPIRSVGAKLARDEASKPNIHVTEPPSSRAGSLPHSIFSGHKIHIQHSPTVGALAREEVSTSNIFIDCNAAFASKPAPTRETRSHPESGRL